MGTLIKNLGVIVIILGALVHEVKTDSQNINMDMSAYSSGIYFIKIYNEEGFTSRKIIKK